MSHITTMKLVVRDLDALGAAARKLGGELVRDQKTHNYYAGKGQCDHAIKLPGVNYEIGVVKSPDGSFKLNMDSYGYDGRRHDGHKLVAAFGEDLKRLNQHYAVAMAEKTARAKGWIVHTQTLPNGSIKLACSGF